MMFLEYLIWGSWLPLLALYLGGVLGFSGGQIGWIFATQAIACLGGLYFGGQIADRMLSTEKLLVRAAPHRRHRDVRARLPDDVLVVLFVMLAYQLAYMPTMSLTNAVVFHHVKIRSATSAGSACGAPSAGSRRAGRSCSSSPARPARI